MCQRWEFRDFCDPDEYSLLEVQNDLQIIIFNINKTKKVYIFVFYRFELSVKRPVPVTQWRKQSAGAESVENSCKYFSVELFPTHSLLATQFQGLN